MEVLCKYLMNIIGRNVIIEFARRHPNARSSLNRWYNLMRQETFDSFTDLRRIFPHADQVKVRKNRFNPDNKTLTVFNIGGNNFRLIASIQYNPKDRRVTVNEILTHAEYDKGRWKE